MLSSQNPALFPMSSYCCSIDAVCIWPISFSEGKNGMFPTSPDFFFHKMLRGEMIARYFLRRFKAVYFTVASLRNMQEKYM